MENDKRFFKIGVFVVSSICLLIIAVLFFGAARFIAPKVYVESYFNESVQGLSVGSSVKYRGIVVGHVDAIDLIGNVYSQQKINNDSIYHRGIYVRVAITDNSFTYLNKDGAGNNLRELIKSGLRIRLTAQGLTGFSYLEITFLDPATNPQLPVTWKTIDPYLPSAASTYNRLTDAVEDIFSSVNGAHSKDLFNNISDLTTISKEAIQASNLPGLSKEFSDSLQSVKNTSDSYKQLADQMNQLISNGKIGELLANVDAVSMHLKSVALQAEKTLNQLSTAMSDANQSLINHQEKLTHILNDTETTVENFKELSSNIKENPSQLLLGSNPPLLDPSKL